MHKQSSLKTFFKISNECKYLEGSGISAPFILDIALLIMIISGSVRVIILLHLVECCVFGAAAVVGRKNDIEWWYSNP